MESVLGKEVSTVLKNEHEKNGVVIHSKSSIKEIKKDTGGNVCGVVLDNGKTIEADMVVVGFGISPSTDFLVKSTVDLKDDGSIPVNPFMQTNQKDIYAAGDVASYPYWVTGESARVEHYINAFN